MERNLLIREQSFGPKTVVWPDVWLGDVAQTCGLDSDTATETRPSRPRLGQKPTFCSLSLSLSLCARTASTLRQFRAAVFRRADYARVRCSGRAAVGRRECAASAGWRRAAGSTAAGCGRRRRRTPTAARGRRRRRPTPPRTTWTGAAGRPSPGSTCAGAGWRQVRARTRQTAPASTALHPSRLANDRVPALLEVNAEMLPLSDV